MPKMHKARPPAEAACIAGRAWLALAAQDRPRRISRIVGDDDDLVICISIT